MKGGNTRHLILGLLVAGALLSVPRFASAATLFVAPSGGQFGVGRVFTVTVRVNTQGAAINASEGTLAFNPAVLEVVSISLNGSIFNLNVQEPDFSNNAGTVRWTGVILNPGYNGPSGNLLTVNFRGIAQGTGTATFATASVLANDGRGTELLNGTAGGAYLIGPATNPTPTTTPAAPTEGGPEVTSPTHPNPVQWYSNNDPTFEWKLPSDVEAVSYLVNTKADANPGNESDGLKSTVQFTDVPDGANYFHIKFQQGGVWGPIRHFPFNVDIQVPEPFAITRIEGDLPTNPQPQLTFSTIDEISGIARYVMRIGDGDWFEVPESPVSHPFVMPLQAPGTHLVTVEAVDRAGNATRATLEVVVVSITPPVITSYPEKVDAQTPFTVAGEAGPNVTVRVKVFRSSAVWRRILFSDETVASVDATSDAAGRWSADMPALSSGIYRVEANAIDERGAVSTTSDPVTIRVGYGLFQQIWDTLRSIGGPVLLPILGILLLAVVLAAIWRRLWFLVPLRRPEDRIVDRLDALIEDIGGELALLSKVGKHRELYPEEQYLRSKLLQYRKNLKVLRTDTHSRLAKTK